MKLSIITINYNNHVGLQKTIDSIICQTWRNYEWIVIDGGSTDGSREIIEKFKDYFTYWCSEHDMGIYNAMNKGILLAHGEYLNFMNSGDCYASESVLESVFRNNHSADILYGFMMRGSINGRIHSASIMKDKIEWYDLYYDNLSHQATFIKKTLFDRYGLYDENLRIVSDWYFFFKTIVLYNASYELLPMKIAIYECNGISETDALAQTERQKILKEFFPKKVTQDIPKLMAFNTIERWYFTRILFSIVYRIAARFSQTFGKSERMMRKISGNQI